MINIVTDFPVYLDLCCCSVKGSHSEGKFGGSKSQSTADQTGALPIMSQSKTFSLTIATQSLHPIYESLYFIPQAQNNIKLMSDKSHNHDPALPVVRIK